MAAINDAATGRRPSVGVIGSGVSGLTAAYLLHDTHAVTVYEADRRAGGHAHTHTVDDGDRRLSIDTGFIVHNEITYPLLRKLFGRLEVATTPTEMSMSIADRRGRFVYAGGRGIGGVFAQRRRVADPQFLGMLMQVKQFHRAASQFLDIGEDDDLTTFGQFLADHRFGRYFIDRYALPLVSCVWSAGARTSLDYPARYLFAFLRNHGMLTVTGSPTWHTVTGGSRQYVDRILATLDDVRLGTAVTGVRRDRDGVEITDGDGRTQRFDRVVVATHPDQALELLTDPTRAERAVLGAFGYTPNVALLHTDASVMPRSHRGWASWNYLMSEGSDPDGMRDRDGAAGDNAPPGVTYWMNRLQALDAGRDYFVSLNAGDRVDPRSVIAEIHYSHPQYTPAAVAAQAHLPALNTTHTAFAGAYHGWGFHEDGCRSGTLAAEHFGAGWSDGTTAASVSTTTGAGGAW
ncbi:NAD(P)/FAD-dependent oxidoreductase [Williamsia sterculiae]|uniref:RCK C-terminal domain-containing protein n=1 Tax=Williamsia sterculiae TaxID=1344003 RepID=A0A1N7H2G7_9NOCA|nr:FAD-dependent oxidoreductase [Williamsia sterculiae]SIS19025.1 hypothetical protein SAMN05445060_3419 [Williamsia sterculiae]